MSLFLVISSAFCILIGLIMTLVNLPGTWVMLIGYVIAFFIEGAGVSLWLVAFVGLMCVVSSVIDNVFSLYIARKSGATRWGMLGALAGSLVGLLLFHGAGFFFGLFLGPCLVELIISKRSLRESAKSGAGAVVGWVLGVASKVFIALGLAVVWGVVLLF